MSAKLALALHAFQKDAPPIHLDATNPHFHSKFASLAGVIAAVRPVLNKHGLVYAQFPTNLDGAPALETMLIHAESGEDIAAVMPLVLTKNDPQGYGSALTYARRYALLSILGLVGDEDDDANSATQARNGSAEAKVDRGPNARAQVSSGSAGGDGASDRGIPSPTAGDSHGLKASRADAPNPQQPGSAVIPWGKHKGKLLRDAPVSYWEWWLKSDMAAKPDFQEFRAMVELHLGLTGAPAGAPDDTDGIPF